MKKIMLRRSVQGHTLNNTLSDAEQRWLNNPNNPNYWLDFNSATPNGDGTFTIVCKPVKMPYKYVIEMFCDFVGAGKAYDKGDWTTKTPINYWHTSCAGKRAMHPYSEALLVKLLEKLSQYDNIEDFYKWYQKNMNMLKKSYNTEAQNETSLF